MRALLQRVSQASVEVEGETTGSIGSGLLIFLGVSQEDDDATAQYVADKCLNMRIFGDENGKFNHSVLDLNKEVLVVSQFTLYGNTAKGRRPSFTEAGAPDTASALYERFIDLVRGYGLSTQAGRFGAMMQVHLVNDGPVTLMVEK